MAKYSEQLAAATRRVIDKLNKLDFAEGEGVFAFNSSLGENQKLNHVMVTVMFSDNWLISKASPNFNVDESNISTVVEFITRANYKIRFGNFYVDYGDGEVVYQRSNMFQGGVPSDDELGSIIFSPVGTWMKYGNAFHKVMFEGANPKAAIEGL
jgi:hypothetical protein